MVRVNNKILLLPKLLLFSKVKATYRGVGYERIEHGVDVLELRRDLLAQGLRIIVGKSTA
jgi:hypothetical protein